MKCKLNLFVAGIGPEDEQQIIRFKALLDTVFEDHTLEVIDVLEKPEMAEAAKILATPTIIRSQSGQSKKYLVDLNHPDKTIRRISTV